MLDLQRRKMLTQNILPSQLLHWMVLLRCQLAFPLLQNRNQLPKQDVLLGGVGHVGW